MLTDNSWIEYNRRKIKHLEVCIDEAVTSGSNALVAEYSRELLKLRECYGSVNGNDGVGDTNTQPRIFARRE